MTLRSVAKLLAFESGAMNLMHRLQHRECLTVVMFHRVLPEQEQVRVGADPLYTVTPELFGECLEFLKETYTPVSLDDVLRSKRRVEPLPRRALLITFDDGWRDNLDWAMPLLGRTPWALFVATDAIAEPMSWWQEVLLWALRTGRTTHEELVLRAASETDPQLDRNDTKDTMHLLLRYARLPPDARRRALAEEDAALRACYNSAQMLTVEQVQLLQQSGVAVAAHGSRHLPLSMVDDPYDDLVRAQQWLAGMVEHATGKVMSFPHGRYDERSLGAARQLGNELMFTSDAVLNACPGGWLQSDVVGRIPISTNSIGNGSNGLQRHRIAAWLFMRKCRSLAT